LPEEGKESIIVPIYKKGDKTNCNNYRGVSLLPTHKLIISIRRREGVDHSTYL